MHLSYRTFSNAAYGYSLASLFSKRNFRACTYPVIDFGCFPERVPINHWMCPAAAYLSINDPIQSIVHSTLGNFAIWSGMYASTIIHQVPKSSPGDPSNCFGSLILISLAYCSSWMRLCLRLSRLILSLFPWSEGGFDPGGRGSSAPPAAASAALPALPAPPQIRPNQEEALSVSLKLDALLPKYRCLCRCTGVDGPACGAWGRKLYLEDSQNLYASITIVNPVFTSCIFIIYSSMTAACCLSSLCDGTSFNAFFKKSNTSFDFWNFGFISFKDHWIPIFVPSTATIGLPLLSIFYSWLPIPFYAPQTLKWLPQQSAIRGVLQSQVYTLLHIPRSYFKAYL